MRLLPLRPNCLMLCTARYWLHLCVCNQSKETPKAPATAAEQAHAAAKASSQPQAAVDPAEAALKDDVLFNNDIVAAYIRGAGAALNSGARAVSSIRLLAYASEAGVSTQAVIPRSVYLSTWALSGVYVIADVFVKVQTAPVRVVAAAARVRRVGGGARTEGRRSLSGVACVAKYR